MLAPTNRIDPTGLIEWNGTFEIAGGGLGPGAARVVFNLESECVAGKRVLINDLVIWAFQTDIGLPFGAVSGDVRLEDGKSSLNPENLDYRNLEGDFSITSFGPTIGPFGLPAGINLGSAKGLGWGSGFDPTVLAQATAGNVKIKGENLAYEDCECEND